MITVRRAWLPPALLALGLAGRPSPMVAAGVLPDRPAGAAATLERPFHVFLPLVNPPGRPTLAVTAEPPRGFYDAALQVRLDSATPGAVIWYTLDGTEPTPGRGRLYTEPLTITRTTVLRAVALRGGRDPSTVATHSYLFLGDVIRQGPAPSCPRPAGEPPCFPSHWGYYPLDYHPSMDPGDPVPADYEMDPQVVAAAEATVREDLRSLPTMSLVTAPEDMFGAERGIYANPLGDGQAWERPASVELIRPDGRPGFQVDCGVRIAGRWSRKPESMAKHSFSLRFSTRYGPGKLHYPLFPDSPVERFDTLRLRAGQADTFHFFPGKAQYLHDQWGRDSQRDMGWPAAHGLFVHLYVNGLYWGLYNLAEEPTADFAASYLGGEEADWDVIKEGHEVEDGDLEAYQAMLDLAAEGPVTPERYERIQAYLDLPAFADYHLLEIYGGNWDWPVNNWRAARRRPGGQFLFFAWDMEHLAQLDTEDVTLDIAGTAGVDGLHGWLAASPEYRLLFADRVQRAFFGEGALTPGAAWRRYETRAAEVERAIVGESARWGDVIPGKRSWGENTAAWCRYLENSCHKECNPRFLDNCPQTLEGQWRPERDRLRDGFFPRRTAVVLQQLCDRGLYPALLPPTLSTTGGGRSSGLTLHIGRDTAGPACAGARGDGLVYFSLDGSDPREAGSGRPARGARVYRGPIALAGFARVMARAAAPSEDGGLVWSAAASATFGQPRLAISELMYHPPAGDDHEWLELANLEAFEVDLSGLTASGITVTLPAGTRLGPGGHAVLAARAEDFTRDHPGVPVLAEFGGKLSDKGERIAFRAPDGAELAWAEYDDEGFWPLAADGRGFSLVPAGPGGTPDSPEAWRASADPGGSPGLADPPPPYQPVWVNEVLPRAGAPREPAIELFNPGPEPARVGGWGLSDDLGVPLKVRLEAGATIPAGGFLVVYEQAFGGEEEGPGLSLAARGGAVYLSSADAAGRLTGLMAGVRHGPAEDGVAFGRFRAGGRPVFAELGAPSFGVDAPTDVADFRRGRGAPNGPPRVGPGIINEIMYHGLDGLPEYVELHNAGPEPLPLVDPERPERRWQLSGAVAFTFPEGSLLPPGGYLVVAGSDPALVRNVYGVPPTVPVLGPWAGKLDNAGERLDLLRPVALPGEAFAPGLVESVTYGPGPPWPRAADGDGPSLERLDPGRYADDAGNWAALSRLGSAGRPNTGVSRLWLPYLTSRR